MDNSRDSRNNMSRDTLFAVILTIINYMGKENIPTQPGIKGGERASNKMGRFMAVCQTKMLKEVAVAFNSTADREDIFFLVAVTEGTPAITEQPDLENECKCKWQHFQIEDRYRGRHHCNVTDCFDSLPQNP